MASEMGVMTEGQTEEQFPQMPKALERAFELADKDDIGGAIAELESSLAEARVDSDALTFQDRVTIALMLADFHMEVGEPNRACEMLEVEVAFVEEHHKSVKQTGTREEKREVVDALTVIRDQRTQMSLLGNKAPEIIIKDWLNSSPVTLADHLGQVVLLEFWATWCKPCHSLFPKVKALRNEFGEKGLRVLGLTRYYFSLRDTGATAENEHELIKKFVADHGIDFPVGIAEDASTQMLYGAVGLPTFVLIDRKGDVRLYGRMGGDGTDPKFEETLKTCIDEAP